MEKLTKSERHKAYIAALKELYRCEAIGDSFLMCVAIRNIVAPDWVYIPPSESIMIYGFEEILKHKPENSTLIWFDKKDYESRKRILEACIEETKE